MNRTPNDRHRRYTGGNSIAIHWNHGRPQNWPTRRESVSKSYTYDEARSVAFDWSRANLVWKFFKPDLLFKTWGYPVLQPTNITATRMNEVNINGCSCMKQPIMDAQMRHRSSYKHSGWCCADHEGFLRAKLGAMGKLKDEGVVHASTLPHVQVPSIHVHMDNHQRHRAVHPSDHARQRRGTFGLSISIHLQKESYKLPS